MRKLAITLAVLFLPANAAAAKVAVKHPCVEAGVQDAYDCGTSMESETDTRGQLTPDGPGPYTTYTSTTGKKYYSYERLTTGPDGQPCVTTGYAEVGTPALDSTSNAAGAHPGGNGFNNYYDFEPCPPQPQVPGQPAETTFMIAARYWERIVLPKPQPRIAPGRAITGKTAYLETNGELAHDYSTNAGIFGTLHLSAKGSYAIDWGDGETSGPYSFEGRPWPDGKITHEYQKVGTYNIVVTEKWTADWSFAGDSGVLRTRQTTGSINNFPVEQIQAVVR